jgi:hypothetical protein
VEGRQRRLNATAVSHQYSQAGRRGPGESDDHRRLAQVSGTDRRWPTTRVDFAERGSPPRRSRRWTLARRDWGDRLPRRQAGLPTYCGAAEPSGIRPPATARRRWTPRVTHDVTPTSTPTGTASPPLTAPSRPGRRGRGARLLPLVIGRLRVQIPPSALCTALTNGFALSVGHGALPSRSWPAALALATLVRTG